MITLGIETSCDETSVALIDDGRIVANEIYSQAIHGRFGGVVPEAASRAHLHKIEPLCAALLAKAGRHPGDINLIAVTDSPGLAGALLVGIGFALGVHAGHSIPITGVNHLEGHICSALLMDPAPAFPFLALVVSGGHTSIYLVKDIGDTACLGRTVDDAAGEAFDKMGKLLGFAYPAGRAIEEEAKNCGLRIVDCGLPESETGRDAPIPRGGTRGERSEAGGRPGEAEIRFPVAKLATQGIDFSFSGLKTAVRYFLDKQTPDFIAENRPRICRAFQEAVVESLVQGALRARTATGIRRLALVGGVACNGRLRQALREHFGNDFFAPPPGLCTDNAAMIARAGYERFTRGMLRPVSMSPTGRIADW